MKPGPPCPLPEMRTRVLSTPALCNCLVQQFALVHRHHLVLLAVHDEEGSGVLVDVGDGIRLGSKFLPVPDRTADEPRHRGVWVILSAACLGEIGRSEPIHDALDSAGLVQVPAVAFQFLHAAWVPSKATR